MITKFDYKQKIIDQYTEISKIIDECKNLITHDVITTFEVYDFITLENIKESYISNDKYLKILKKLKESIDEDLNTPFK